MDIRAYLKLDTSDASKKMDEFGKKAEEAAKKGNLSYKQMGAVVAGAVTAVGALAVAAAKSIDRIGKLNQQLGLSTEFLGSMSLVADLSGTSLDSLASSTAKLSKNMSDFVNRGVGEGKIAFEQMGISAAQLKPIMNDSQAQLSLVADRFATMKDGAEKTTLAMKLFGESGVQLIPLLNQGSKGFAAMTKEAQELGLVLSQDQVRNVEGMNDAFTKLTSGVGGLVKQLVAANSEWVKNSFDWLTGKIKVLIGIYPLMVKEFEHMINDTVYGVKLLGSWFQELGIKIGYYFEDAWRSAADGFVNLLVKIASGMEMVPFWGDEMASSIRSAASDIISTLGAQTTLEERLAGLNRDKLRDAQIYLTTQRSISAETQKQAESAVSGPTYEYAGGMATSPSIEEARKRGLELLNQERMSGEQALIDAGAQYSARQQLFTEALSRQLLTDQEYKTYMLANEKRYQDEVKAIQSESYDARAKFAAMSMQDQISTVAEGMNNILSVSNTQSRKFFQLQKLAAIANATVKGYEAVQNAYTWGTSWGGPAGGTAMGALAAAASAIQIQGIRSASFGGAGGNLGAASTGSVPTLSTQPPTNPVQSSSRGTTYVNVTVLGSVTTEQGLASNVIEAIKERAASDEIIIDPDSANGMLLRTV